MILLRSTIVILIVFYYAAISPACRPRLKLEEKASPARAAPNHTNLGNQHGSTDKGNRSSELSTGAKTFKANRQNGARELRQSMQIERNDVRRTRGAQHHQEGACPQPPTTAHGPT